jgi:hypothetical protein
VARPNNRAAINAKILGLTEAKRAFEALPEIARDEYNWATELTLREITRLAIARLLSSGHVRTRALVNHIGWTLNKKSGQGRAGVLKASTVMVLGGQKVRVRGIVQAGKGGSALKSQGARVIRPSKYGHLIEFDTGPGKTEPFMRPAVAAEQSHYLARCRDAGQRIEKGVANIGMRTL